MGIFLSSIYGRYFGVGLGMVLLAVMAVPLPFEIHELQGIRNAFSMIINSIAALIFIVRVHLARGAVYMRIIGTLIGSWMGTRLIKRLSPKVVRVLVVANGVATTIYSALGN